MFFMCPEAILTLDIELDLSLSSFDVKPVIGGCLTPVRAHEVPGDVGKAQAPVQCLHHPLAIGHCQVLVAA